MKVLAALAILAAGPALAVEIPPQALDRAATFAGADVVISCTGAVRPVVSLADVHHALAASARDELAAEAELMCAIKTL